jgi:hypothetical protein
VHLRKIERMRFLLKSSSHWPNVHLQMTHPSSLLPDNEHAVETQRMILNASMASGHFQMPSEPFTIAGAKRPGRIQGYTLFNQGDNKHSRRCESHQKGSFRSHSPDDQEEEYPFNFPK